MLFSKHVVEYNISARVNHIKTMKMHCDMYIHKDFEKKLVKVLASVL